jgi:mono/diheme cytochrome c family protein
MKFRKNPAKIFGLVYPYLFIIGLGIGIYYLNSINSVGRHQVPLPLPDTTNVPVDLILQEPSTVKSVDLMKVAQPSDSLIQMGKNIFQTTCTACHGADGKGDGPASTGLNPPPRDFTSKANWINGPKLTGIFQTLQEGIKGSAMVAYQQFSPTQRFALAHYIRSTFVPDPPAVTNDEMASLDQLYNLSKGTYIPGQIPIADAEKLIILESQSKVNEITQLMGKISGEENNSGAKIFNAVTNNKSRALSILVNSNTWKNNEEEFINMIMNNVDHDGFNGKVLNLSTDEWDILYNYLKTLFV